MPSHLSFSIVRRALANRILIPKYYDPEVDEWLQAARKHFDLVPLAELLDPGEAGSRLGHWIRRDFYGTGNIPYVRTSDFSHWRLRADFKKGVSEEVYLHYASIQDVQPGDILMVAHGTYLVGLVAIVTEHERRLVLQDHVFRLRVRTNAPVDAYYLLAALSTDFCRRQIRIRQFSADIIDKIGDRHLEVMIPIARDRRSQAQVSASVRSIIERQDQVRTVLREVCESDFRMLRERSDARHCFSISRRDIQSRVLLPKYYDPVLEDDLHTAEEQSGFKWTTLGELVSAGVLSATTGVEVGKLVYGTGDIPFVRTSDIADLELKRDTKHGVSRVIYDEYAAKASISAGDILVVRDGTYLVGSSALVSDDETPALICGGLYRLRCQAEQLDPYALLPLLNLPIVRRQMRAKQFTRDVIDTLGKRLLEVRIPHPTSGYAIEKARQMQAIMIEKAHIKRAIDAAIASVEPDVPQVVTNRPGWSMRG